MQRAAHDLVESLCCAQTCWAGTNDENVHRTELLSAMSLGDCFTPGQGSSHFFFRSHDVPLQQILETRGPRQSTSNTLEQKFFYRRGRPDTRYKSTCARGEAWRKGEKIVFDCLHLCAEITGIVTVHTVTPTYLMMVHGFLFWSRAGVLDVKLLHARAGGYLSY